MTDSVTAGAADYGNGTQAWPHRTLLAATRGTSTRARQTGSAPVIGESSAS
jgi:hypothetical protein